MTSGGEIGATGESARALCLPRSFWAAYAVILLLIAGVGASSAWLEAPNRAARAAWPYVVDELTSVALIFALTPPLWRLTRRLDPRRIGWAAAGLGHALGLAAFCAVHVAGMIGLRMALYPLFGASYSGEQDWLVDVMLYESRKDALTYGGLVAFGWLLLKLLRRAEPEAAPDRVIEAPVRIPHRDGPVLTWIPTSNVLWVEAAGNYVELKLASRAVLQRQTLSSMEALLNSAGFLRIHRSRLVNPAHVRAVVTKESGDFTLVLADGRELAGSRRYRSSLDGLSSIAASSRSTTP